MRHVAMLGVIVCGVTWNAGCYKNYKGNVQRVQVEQSNAPQAQREAEFAEAAKKLNATKEDIEELKRNPVDPAREGAEKSKDYDDKLKQKYIERQELEATLQSLEADMSGQQIMEKSTGEHVINSSEEQALLESINGLYSQNQDCEMSAQLLHGGDSVSNATLISNKVCIKEKGGDYREPTPDEFFLFNVQQGEDGAPKYFKYEQYCTVKKRFKWWQRKKYYDYTKARRNALCQWNGKLQHSWPLDLRIEANPFMAGEKPLGGAKIFINGKLVQRASADKDNTSLLIKGRDIIQDYMPYGAPISIQVFPTSSYVVQGKLEDDIESFDTARRSALQIIEGTFSNYLKESDATFTTNAQCMAIHAKLTYVLTQGLFKGESSTSSKTSPEIQALAAKWQGLQCETLDYGKTLATQKQCFSVNNYLTTPEDLAGARADIFKAPPATQITKQVDLLGDLKINTLEVESSQVATGLNYLKLAEQEVECAEQVGFLSAEQAFLQARRDWKGIVVDPALLDVVADATIKGALQDKITSVTDKLNVTLKEPGGLEVSLTELTTQLTSYEGDAKVDNLLKAIGALQQGVQTYQQVRQLVAEVELGFHAIRDNFQSLRTQAKKLIKDEDELLLVYQSFTTQLPTESELFVSLVQNPAPSKDVVWTFDATHVDPWQKFWLVTWNAVPIAAKGTAYVDPIDVSTAIPLVDVWGRRWTPNKHVDLRMAFGGVFFKEQIEIEQNGLDDFEEDYLNGGPVFSIGFRSLRLGLAWVFQTPYQQLESEQIDSILSNLSDGTDVVVGSGELFGRARTINDLLGLDRDKGLRSSRFFNEWKLVGSSRFRFFIGVDLFKLITNESTGFSQSATPTPSSEGSDDE